MLKIKKEYYTLKEVAQECPCTITDLLHYGETGQLQIGIVLPPIKIKFGPFTCGGGNCHPVSGLFFLYSEDIPLISRGEGFIRYKDQKGRAIYPEEILKIQIADIVICHSEKLRFEAACDMAGSDDIGEKERTTWLKIIYLLMHELADCKPILVKTDGLNISQFEKILKGTARKHDLSDKGLSNSTLSKIYNEAMMELMPGIE